MSKRFRRFEQKAYEKGYRITEEGDVVGLKKEKVGFTHGNGYRRFKMRDENGENINVAAHRLQAYQKFGEGIYQEGMVVRHLDGNPDNNHVDNIAIGTMRENIMDRPAAERLAHAIHASSFVKKHDHEAIYKYYKECESYKKTMEHFAISSKGTLHHILKKYEND